MTPEQLDRLEQLAREATPGPWHHGPLFWEGWAAGSTGGGMRVFEVPHLYPDGATQPGVYVDPEIGRSREPDAAYIAALSPDVVSELVAAARLGAAWQEAEAALPEGWRGPWLWPDPEEGPYVADAASGEIMPVGLREVGIRASGPTPAAALLALAEALRERP